MHIGDVTTIPQWKCWDKHQAVKVLEESAEVFAAWQLYDGAKNYQSELLEDTSDVAHAAFELVRQASIVDARDRIICEAADLITALCNLLAGLGVTDMSDAMLACEVRNRERGRL